MVKQSTLFMIKPDAVERRIIGDLIAVIERNGFKVKQLKMFTFTRESAKSFYDEHKGKIFFDPLISFMTSGPSVGLELEGEDAIAKIREIMGSTDPKRAASGTIRHKYAVTQRFNCVHGSDSTESAAQELAFIFSEDVE